MLAIKKARKIIEADPTSTTSLTLSELVLALEHDGNLSLPKLYALDYKTFELALEILSEWRLDRYYASKVRLLDVSSHAMELASPAHATTPSDVPGADA
jgi:hypothetical protein